MATPPAREQFLRQGDGQWAALQARLGDRTDEELLRPGASGPQWSGKDVLAHLTRWHEHALEGIRAIVAPDEVRLLLESQDPLVAHSVCDEPCWNRSSDRHREDRARSPCRCRPAAAIETSGFGWGECSLS